MFDIFNDEGKQFSITLNESSLLEIAFSLGWSKGYVKGTCSKERIEDLRQSLADYQEVKISSIEFINEDGNIDFEVKRTSTGNSEITTILIPSMIDDDRIEFNFQGVIKL